MERITTFYLPPHNNHEFIELTNSYNECLREAYEIYGGEVNITQIQEIINNTENPLLPFFYTNLIEARLELKERIRITNFPGFLSWFANILPPAPENEEDILSILLKYSIPPQFKFPFLRNQVWTLLNKKRGILKEYYKYYWWKMAAFTWLSRYKATGNLKSEFDIIKNIIYKNSANYPSLEEKQKVGLLTEILVIAVALSNEMIILPPTPFQDLSGIDFWLLNGNKVIPISVKTGKKHERVTVNQINFQINSPFPSKPPKIITLSGIEIKANPESKTTFPIFTILKKSLKKTLKTLTSQQENGETRA